MADLKISQLGPFSETDVVAADVLALADVSAQLTKKIAASDLVKAGARLNADTITFGNDVVVTGDLTVNGTTTTINTQDLVVEDKNVIIGNVTTPSDVTADGGGITLKGTTDKTINWVDSTDAWTLSEHVNIASGKEYRIAGTKVLDATSLGSAVVSSSLTSVGTIGTGVWQGTTIGTGYGGTGQTTYADGELLIGKTDGTLAKATITAGTGVSVTNGDGTITIAATGSGGTVTAVTATSPLASTGGTTPDISIQDGTTAQKGAVQLEDSTSSTSTTTAATPNAVKTAYDLANAALPASGGTLTGDVTLNAQSDLRFADADSSNWVAFQAPATVASNVTWTLPDADGTSGQVLSTNGSGTLSWATAAAGGASVTTSDTAPSSPSDGDLWYDSVGGRTYVYYDDGDTSQWVDAAPQGAGGPYGLGSASAPSITFLNDSNTGIYSPGADQLALSTNGTGRIHIGSTGTVNIVGAGTAGSTQAVSFNGSAPVNSVVLDSSGRLGIGTSSPSYLLDCKSTGTTNVARFLTGSTSSSEVAQFGRSDQAVNLSIDYDGAGSMGIGTTTAHPFNLKTGAVTRATIDTSGRVGIGSSAPKESIDCRGAAVFSGDHVTSANAYDTAHGIMLSSTSGLATIKGVSNGANSVAIRFVPLNSGSGSEAARFDASGRLLVGTSSSRSDLSGPPLVQIEGANDNGQRYMSLTYGANAVNGPYIFLAKHRGTTVGGTTVVQSGDQLGALNFYGHDGTDFEEAARIQAFVDGTPGTDDMPGRLVFSTTADGASSPTERIRIDSAGHVLGAGMTSLAAGSSVKGWNLANLSDHGRLNIHATSGAGTAYAAFFYHSGSSVGSISITSSATAFNTSSDYRLKENVTPVTDGITRLQQLKPSRFNFIADPTKTVDGFLAHEVQAIVPEAITGEKDAVDENGDPVYQGIDQSKLVPLLTAALQEAVAKIESLEARLTAAGI